MMKIAILGASGKIGEQVTTQALERGFRVVALCRDPEKLKMEHNNLDKVKVDIKDPATMERHMLICSAVVSCLGVPPRGFSNFTQEVSFYSDTIKPIIEAMKLARVRRFVCISSWCTEDKPGNPKLFQYFIKPVIFSKVIADMARMEQYLTGKECEILLYTIVRPGLLKDGDKTDGELKVEVDGFGIKGCLGYEKISRGDVARFIVDCLEKHEHERKGVAIGI